MCTNGFDFVAQCVGSCNRFTLTCVSVTLVYIWSIHSLCQVEFTCYADCFNQLYSNSLLHYHFHFKKKSLLKSFRQSINLRHMKCQDECLRFQKSQKTNKSICFEMSMSGLFECFAKVLPSLQQSAGECRLQVVTALVNSAYSFTCASSINEPTAAHFY